MKHNLEQDELIFYTIQISIYASLTPKFQDTVEQLRTFASNEVLKLSG